MCILLVVTWVSLFIQVQTYPILLTAYLKPFASSQTSCSFTTPKDVFFVFNNFFPKTRSKPVMTHSRKRESLKAPRSLGDAFLCLRRATPTPTGVSTGMHPQGEWGLSSEFVLFLKSAVDALYCTQKWKQTCRMKKFLSLLMHFWPFRSPAVSM